MFLKLKIIRYEFCASTFSCKIKGFNTEALYLLETGLDYILWKHVPDEEIMKN